MGIFRIKRSSVIKYPRLILLFTLIDALKAIGRAVVSAYIHNNTGRGYLPGFIPAIGIRRPYSLMIIGSFCYVGFYFILKIDMHQPNKRFPALIYPQRGPCVAFWKMGFI